jgi:hypothetical protein
MRLDKFIERLQETAKGMGNNNPVVALQHLGATIAVHVVSPIEKNEEIKVELMSIIPSETKMKDIDLNEPEKFIMLDVFRSE